MRILARSRLSTTPLRWLAALLLALMAGLPGPARAIEVIASFSVLADLVSQVGGEHIVVSSLVGRDEDGHVFQPRPSELARLRNADLVVVNGLGFEGWMTRLLQSAGYRGPVVVATDGVDPMPQPAPQRGTGREAPDPHAWQDPAKVQVYIDNIVRALADVDPAHAETYRQRARHYQERLRQLDEQIADELGALSEDRRTVVTPHAAMRYFGERYGLQFLAAQGPNAGSEPGAREIAQLIQQMRASGTAVIFRESPGTPALLRQLARESGAPLAGRLYSDTLSPLDGPAGTYLDMMTHNTRQLREALAGTP
ncbi:MAG: metal ABC transporter solute-binding protein, Zn/Mn family [Pigmentiphaga sp.]